MQLYKSLKGLPKQEGLFFKLTFITIKKISAESGEWGENKK
jgi:hypothetical protein